MLRWAYAIFDERVAGAGGKRISRKGDLRPSERASKEERAHGPRKVSGDGLRKRIEAALSGERSSREDRSRASSAEDLRRRIVCVRPERDSKEDHFGLVRALKRSRIRGGVVRSHLAVLVERSVWTSADAHHRKRDASSPRGWFSKEDRSRRPTRDAKADRRRHPTLNRRKAVTSSPTATIERESRVVPPKREHGSRARGL